MGATYHPKSSSTAVRPASVSCVRLTPLTTLAGPSPSTYCEYWQTALQSMS